MQRMETAHGKSGYRTAGFLFFHTVIALDKLNDIREAAFMLPSMVLGSCIFGLTKPRLDSPGAAS